MYKFIKIIPALIFLVNSTVSYGAQQPHEQLNDNGLIARAKALYQKEGELRNTFTYQTLVSTEIILTSLLNYTSLGPWGVLGNASYRLVQHNAPSGILKVTETFLTESLQAGFRQFMTTAMIGFHGYDFCNNPLRQIFGYVFGLSGAYLSQHVLEGSSLSQNSRKEWEAFVYYCCRKAGWKTVERFYENAFPCQESPKAEVCLPTGKGEPCRDSEAQTPDQENLDIAPIKKFLPQCASPELEKEAGKVFNKTAAFITEAYNEAKGNSRELGILWFEDHLSCDCKIQESLLFNLMKASGIQDLYMEYTEDLLAHHIRAMKESLRIGAPPSLERYGQNIFFIGALANATMSGLNVRYTEQPVLWGDKRWVDSGYFHELQRYNRGKPAIDFDRCPDFTARDRHMINSLENAPRSFAAIFGIAHFGAIYEALQGLTKTPRFDYIYISCYPKDSPLEVEEEQKFYDALARELAQAFGEGCVGKLREVQGLYTLYNKLSPSDLYNSFAVS